MGIVCNCLQCVVKGFLDCLYAYHCLSLLFVHPGFSYEPGTDSTEPSSGVLNTVLHTTQATYQSFRSLSDSFTISLPSHYAVYVC